MKIIIFSILISLIIFSAVYAEDFETNLSKLYLGKSHHHLKIAREYAEKSQKIFELNGFSYEKYLDNLKKIFEELDRFINPKRDDASRVIQDEIDGEYLAEGIDKALKRGGIKK